MPSRIGTHKTRLNGPREVTLDQIQALFGAGEQGVIQDLLNPASVFQERTGASATTPSGANGPIGSLKDWSPNGNWAVAPSDAARPIYRSQSYGQLDGIDDTLLATFTNNTAITRITALAISVGSSPAYIFDCSTDVKSLYQQTASPNILKSYSGAVLGALPAANSEFLVVTQKFSGDANSAIAKNNQNYTVGSAGANLSCSDLRIGRYGGVNIAFGNFNLYRVVQISRILSEVEIALCGTWCGAAGGLAL